MVLQVRWYLVAVVSKMGFTVLIIHVSSGVWMGLQREWATGVRKQCQPAKCLPGVRAAVNIHYSSEYHQHDQEVLLSLYSSVLISQVN